MLLTLLCPVYNIDLKYLVQSLENQTEKYFTLHILDYGSDEKYAQSYDNLTQKYNFIQYFRLDFGYKKYWNRSLVLNIGLKNIKTSYIFVIDADLWLSPQFFSLLKEKLKENTFFQCLLYRIKSQKDNELFFKNQDFECQLANPQSAFGIAIFTKKNIQQIGGYDTFFRVWGMEDLELKDAFEKFNYKIEQIYFEEAKIFHIWHKPNYLDLPTHWQEIIKEHRKNNFLATQRDNFLAQTPSTFSTNAQELIKNKKLSAENQFIFQFPLTYNKAKWYQKWYQLNENEYIWISQSFEEITKKNTLASRFFSFCNKILKKINISYRFVNIHETLEYVSYKDLKDFIFYFVLTHENQIKDYYLEENENKIEFLVIKKI
jgi:hypothetical protein